MKPKYFTKKALHQHIGLYATYIWCEFNSSLDDALVYDHIMVKRVITPRGDFFEASSVYGLAPSLSFRIQPMLVDPGYFFRPWQKALNMTTKELADYLMWLKLQRDDLIYPETVHQ